MADLLFWFLLSQTLAGLPEMTPGTEVQILSSDLMAVYATAVVENNTLVFRGPLEPGKEIRLVIYPPSESTEKQEQATVDALNAALYGNVSPEGNDILIQFEELDGPLSFKKWLAEERDISLQFIPAPTNSDPQTRSE